MAASSRSAAFRLARHHLLKPTSAGLVDVCRDIGGAQAQVMSCAEMQLWARMRHVSRSEISRALVETRSIVKTISVRGTLHLIPADEFALYSVALRNRQMNVVANTTTRFGISTKDIDGLNARIMDALDDGPLGRAELTRRVRPHASKKLKWWIDRVWHLTRPAMAEGLVCYGPGEGGEVRFVRADQWLGKHAVTTMSAADAQRTLLRRCLSLYGPITMSDFCHWTGLSVREAKPVWDSMRDLMTEVDGSGRKAFLLREDVEPWRAARMRSPHVRLLPSFDVLLLGHATKDHLVEPKHYKRVYRSSAWISPVILLDGRIAGVWAINRRGKSSSVKINALTSLSPKARAVIRGHQKRLAEFFI